MRYLKPALAAAGLLAAFAPALGAHAAPAAATRESTPLATAARAQVCAAQHPEVEEYLFKGWVRNHCTRAPTGRFDYLSSGWQCLCMY